MRLHWTGEHFPEAKKTKIHVQGSRAKKNENTIGHSWDGAGGVLLSGRGLLDGRGARAIDGPVR